MARFKKNNKTKGVYEFFCPGCKINHNVWTKDEKHPHPVWRFNNDVEHPTVHPSILITWNYDNKHFVCHSYITSGRIQFLSDCTHKLAGHTVNLPDIVVE